jgi:hypothetical protein
MVYHYSDNDHETEEPMPLFSQIQIWLHTFSCSECARKIEHYETARRIMHNDFFPPSPHLEDSVMSKIAADEELSENAPYAIPGGLSTRGWIIAGLIIFVSLATSFFGLDFQKIADETGISFLLPFGITAGIVLTSYCAFFIGSHIKELTERFGL